MINAVSYNNRLQRTETKLGTTAVPTFLDLVYNYDTTNGDGQSGNHGSGSLSYTESFSYHTLINFLTAQEFRRKPHSRKITTKLRLT